MSEQGFNIWGLVAGVLGTVGLLPIFWSLIKSQMPSEKLRAVEALLAETEAMLSSGVEEGLLTYEEFRLMMWTTKSRIDDARAQIYAATTWKEELRNWRQGLSAKSTVLRGELNKIRAAIARSSSEERGKLGLAGKAAELVLSSRKHREDSCPAAPPAESALPPSASSVLLAGSKGAGSPDGPWCPARPTTWSASEVTLTRPSEHRDDATLCEATISGAATKDDAPSTTEVPPVTSACSSCCRKASRKKCHLSRQAVLASFGQELLVPPFTPARPAGRDGQAATPPRTGRSRLRRLADLLRRCDDMQLQDAIDARTLSAILSSNPICNNDYDGDDESDE
ncbi:hypothetical protein BV20DRAFT_1057921 [Pilatotrama ljubarskyi]|nr:hypothetical protein BV20DRAFT_1057921 [Pilatotrama ljubarskyi]